MIDLNRVVLALAALALAGGAYAQTPPQVVKFGFVDTARILRDAAPAIRAQKKLEAEFQKRGQDMQRMEEQLKRLQGELEKNALTMNDTQRRAKEREFAELSRDFQRKDREFRDDRNQRSNEELAQVIEQANRVIRQIAEREKFDLIIQDVVYFSSRVDITDQVIKALDAGKPSAK